MFDTGVHEDRHCFAKRKSSLMNCTALLSIKIDLKRKARGGANYLKLSISSERMQSRADNKTRHKIDWARIQCHEKSITYTMVFMKKTKLTMVRKIEE